MAAGLGNTARSVQADFMKLSEKFPANHFDGVYAIEATCHAPEREKVYGEIFKVLKAGHYFACYEWCLTPLYDAKNEGGWVGGWVGGCFVVRTVPFFFDTFSTSYSQSNIPSSPHLTSCLALPCRAEHRLIKKKIEEGDGLPDMATQQQCVDALKSVGFEVCVCVCVCVVWVKLSFFLISFLISFLPSFLPIFHRRSSRRATWP